MAVGIVVDELPVAHADGAGRAYSGARIPPDIGVVPHHEAVPRAARRIPQEGHETLSVHLLRHIPRTYAGYFEYGGEEIFYDEGRGAAAAGICNSGPAHYHGLAYAALVCRALAAVQGIVLGIEGLVPPPCAGAVPAVVGHEDYHGVVCQAAGVQPAHQVPEALVHAFYQRGVGRLLFAHALGEVFLEEARVAVDGDVHGVVRHVKEKRGGSGVQGRQGLLRERLGEEGAAVPVLLQPRNREGRDGSAVGSVAVVVFGQI